MAVNLDAIRKRMAELNGGSKTSSVQLWKPEPGEYKVRCLPWKNQKNGEPFEERWFYYIGNQSILTPKQFGKPDSVDDLIRKLFGSGKPDDREMAKALYPRMKAYTPILLRGAEDKGILVWSFNKLVYQRLLSFFVDEELNADILDPIAGFDLKVKVVKSAKKFNGRDVFDFTIDPVRNPSKLHEDPKQLQAYLEAVPNLGDLYREKTKEEIDSIVNTWLSGGESPSGDNGTPRGAPPAKDALDELVHEVRSAAKAAPKVAEPAKKAPARKPAPDPVIEEDKQEEPVKKQSLDDAFDSLMTDE